MAALSPPHRQRRSPHVPLQSGQVHLVLDRIDAPEAVNVQVQEVEAQRHDPFGQDVAEGHAGLVSQVDASADDRFEEAAVGFHRPEVRDLVPGPVGQSVDAHVVIAVRHPAALQQHAGFLREPLQGPRFLPENFDLGT